MLAVERLHRPHTALVGRPPRTQSLPSTGAWRHLPEGLRPYVRLLYLPAADPALPDKLSAFQPAVLTATPTTLDLLAGRADRPQLPQLRQVVTWSETLTDAARARIGAAFGVPVLDTYGLGECLFLSTGCPTDPGAHVNADWAVLEVVDEVGQSVPPGRLGHKALLTNLASTVQPLIRYEVGDRVQMAAGPCRCGSRLPRVERVLGRSADYFWVRSGPGYRPLSAYPFQHAFEQLRQVREWQVTQRERNRLLVRFELLPGSAFDLARAQALLEERLGLAGFGGELEVELEVVSRLAADLGTGKFRRLISLVGVPDDLGGARASARAAVAVEFAGPSPAPPPPAP